MHMRPGAVLVDIAVDQGGCAETSRPTTHDNPIYIEHGVVHYCAVNMPGAYPNTATRALTNASFPYVRKLAGLGLKAALHSTPELRSGLNTWQGKVTHKAVADSLGLPYHPLE